MALPSSHRVTRAHFPSMSRGSGVGGSPAQPSSDTLSWSALRGGAQSTCSERWKEGDAGRAGAACVSSELQGLPWLRGTSSTSCVCEKGPGSLTVLGVAQHTGCCLRASSRLLLLLPGMLCPEAVLQDPGLEHPPPRPWSWVVGREGRVSVSRW